MLIRRSAFAHALTLAPGRILLLHAISQLSVALDAEAAQLFQAFDSPRALPQDLRALADRFGQEPRTLAGAVAALMERGFLTEKSEADEAADFARELGETGARDPSAPLARYRRAKREGAAGYWAARRTEGLADLAPAARRLDVALVADCDLQMEAEYLRLEGRARGFDLRVGATFPDELDLLADRSCDVVILGASRARAAVFDGRAEDYLAEARRLIAGVRAHTSKPVLLDNLPEPTVQPLGLAERGARGHRNRVRAANLALADIAEEFADVHVVDVANALAQAGSASLIDDGLVAFGHLGSPGWLLQRPKSELAAVHGVMPPPDGLAAALGLDPTRRETLIARTHMDALTCVLGLDAKKAVVVDLDGVLWPGVLAETGAPFAWSPEISGPYSHIGVYFGLHEALKCLQRRGILLAAASKNDEAVVRTLWSYPAHYPRDRLLTLNDFASHRIGWGDKPAALRAIAAELGCATSAMLFIDDSALERARVAAELPEVETWGEDLYALRRRLLEDPRLQRPRVTAEAAARSDLVKAQISRERMRAEASDNAAFLASLEIESEIFAPAETDLPRIAELFARTTQFNTTGAQFTAAELACASVLAMRVRDRFADHGLVGAAVVADGEIVGLAMSCRVIGLKVEHQLLAAALAAFGPLRGRIVETDRNGPVRHFYRDGGFTLAADGYWRNAA